MHDRRGHHRVPVSSRAALARAMAIAIAVVAIAACSPPAPSASATTPLPTTAPTTAPTPTPIPTTAAPTSPAPTASPLPASVADPCTVADLKASHGRVEGAAGSQFTEVVLVSAIRCSIDLYPSVGLRDANGAALVGGIPTGSGRVDLVAGAAYVSAIRLANWCRDDSPAFPLALEIRLGAGGIPVTGDSFPAEGETPPCNGETIPPLLEGGPWTPQ